MGRNWKPKKPRRPSWRLPFRVDCGNGVRSAFNDYSEAMNYGQWRSAVSGGRTEISNKHGDLVGQYSAGKTTPEFSSHHVSAGAPAYALDGG